MTLVKSIAAQEEADKADSVAKAKDLLDHATKTILIAKDAKDLDGLVIEMQNALDRSRYLNARDAQRSLESANRFVRDWQSYLVDKNMGEAQKAAFDLHNIAERENTFLPIPRSELLARAEKESAVAQYGTAVPSTPTKISRPASPEKPGGKIATPDEKFNLRLESYEDIPAIISQLEALQRTGVLSGDVYSFTNELSNLERAEEAFQEKDFAGALQQLSNQYGGGPTVISTHMEEPSFSVSALHGAIVKLKNKLKLQIIQGLLAFPNQPTPAANEIATDYLLRLAAYDEKASDWTKLQNILLVYQQAGWPTTISSPWLLEDLAGLRSYFIGVKQEEAQQTLDAIRSYRKALAIAGKYFPAEPAAAKLESLQEKFPAVYKEAVEQPITEK